MRWLLLVMFAGCYSPGFTTGAPCETDADCPAKQVCAATGTCELHDVDAGVDGAALSCWSTWFTGPKFSAPRPISELNTAGPEADGSLAEDDLVLYFERNDGSGNGPDIWRASRMTPSAMFGQATVVTSFQSPASDSRVSTAVNDSIAIFASQRLGGAGATDLYYALRNASGGWDSPTQTLLVGVNDAGSQFDPELSPDGLHLYLAPNTPAPQHIAMASRASVTAPFGAPTTLGFGGARAEAFDVTISPDERVIVFASADLLGDTDIYFATRASASAAFGVATALSAINSAQVDADPELSQDGCSLIFASSRTGSMGRDLYIVDVIR